jgi:O-antigen/teichoic acid export membrane protein
MQFRHKPGSFGHGVLTLAGGTAGVQALYLICLPILTRLFTVHEMGDLTVYQALLSILLVVAAFRYEVAIYVSGDDHEAISVLALSVASVFLSSLVVAAGFFVLSITVDLGEQYSVVTRYWGLIWLGQIGAGLALVLTQWTLRQRSFATVATARVSQVFSQLVTQLALGFAGIGGAGLLIGDVVGRLTGAATLALRLVRREGHLLGGIRASSIVRDARVHAGYPMYSTPAALLNTVTLQLPPILFLFMFGQHVAGWFGLMIRVCSAPMMLIGKSVSDAYASEFSRLLRDNPAALKPLFTRTFRKLALLGLAPLCVILIAGPWLFGLVFGADWAESGVYARFVALYTFAEFCCFPLFLTPSLLRRQRVQLAWDALLIGALLAGLWTVWSLGWGPRAAVLYYGLCFALMYFIHVWISFRMLSQVHAAGVPAPVAAASL